MFMCRNAEGVHAYLSKGWRGTWSKKGWDPCTSLTGSFEVFHSSLTQPAGVLRLKVLKILARAGIKRVLTRASLGCCSAYSNDPQKHQTLPHLLTTPYWLDLMTLLSATQCELWLNVSSLHHQTIWWPWQATKLLNFVTKELHCVPFQPRFSNLDSYSTWWYAVSAKY